MLVLSRRHGEEIHVGDNVVIKVLAVTHGRVRVGIEAPRDVQVRRSELLAADKYVSPVRNRPARDERNQNASALAGTAH